MSAKDIAARYAAEATNIVDMIAHLTQLRTKNTISIGELELAAEAGLLSLHTAFEAFVRELFLQCVTGTADIRHVKSRLRFIPAEDVPTLIAGDRPFLEWLPVDRTVDRALIHLRSGQPFVRLWQRQEILRHLELMHIARNRIAHSSEQALAKYKKMISKGEAAFTQPGRWLIHSPSTKTNLQLIAEATIAVSIALSVDDRTPSQLGSAKMKEGQRAAPGTYRCDNCRRIQHLPVWDKLKPCRHCSSSTKCSTCGNIEHTKTDWTLEALKAVG
ncbi:hypothetical protein ACFWXB_14340 [Tsukamurella tyrosinosolvens]|uniref:hypothetical protein n=1 Tax=Tsukamurella tyrosinosolvens TaxID=57704 RepID=UPI001AF99871|nr:hypothetical protein [Tsukamurella tyrosinosolvens]QRY82778.1 hypothetical protein JVY00_12720 [Tsukamurella tyrosinosolvens]